MELVESIPISNINTQTAKWEINRPLNFSILDVNLTEPDYKRNPVLTRLGQKKRINVTISGYVTEPYKINVTNIKGSHTPDLISKEIINIKDKVLNITFYGVRVLRDREWDYNINNVITVPRLMIDNTHELYGFLKPIYVNNDEMTRDSEKNIYLTFQELKDYLKYSTVKIGTKSVSNGVSSELYWITKYKKGDSNGVKSH